MKNIDEVIEEIKEMFLNQDFPRQLGYQIIKAKEDKPSAHWSILNRLIMHNIGHTYDARTFKQWQAVGRHVKKGAKAFAIIAPITVTDKKVDQVTGKEQEEIKVIGFRGMPVFAYEVTDGDPLPVTEDNTQKPNSANTSNLMEAIKRLGGKISYAPYDGSTLGYYRPSTNEIVLSDRSTITLAHESAHFVVHHVLRREMKRNLEECTAELTALTFCELFAEEGYEVQSYDYIREYAGLTDGTDPRNVIQVISRVTNTVAEIITVLLSAMDKHN